MKYFSNREIKLTLFLVLTLGFYSTVKAHTDTEYSSPTGEVVTIYETLDHNHIFNDASAAQAFACSEMSLTFPLSSWENFTCPTGTSSDSISITFTAQATNSSSGGVQPVSFVFLKSEESIVSCQDPFFPISEDLSGNGQPDHCHVGSCSAGDMVPISIPQGSQCVTMADGSNCEFYGSNDESGNVANNSFATGEGCNCDDDPNGCVDNPEAVYGEDGCAFLGSSEFCLADPAEKCDENGLCEDGCGFINAAFVCESDTPGVDDPTVDDDPCLANDPRPSCAGVPEGEQPNQDSSILEALNKNNNQNKLLLEKLSKLEQAIKGDDATAKAKRLAEEGKVDVAIENYTDDMEAGLSDLANGIANPEATLAIEGFEDGLGELGFLSSASAAIIPSSSGGCANFSFSVPKNGTYSHDNCDVSNSIRIILGWGFYLALLARAIIIFRRSSET